MTEPFLGWLSALARPLLSTLGDKVPTELYLINPRQCTSRPNFQYRFHDYACTLHAKNLLRMYL